MTQPDYSHGFLRVPLAVWRDLYCRCPLTRRQLQLLSVVLRETWGWQAKGGAVREWTRPLAPGDFAVLTGLSTDRLRRDLDRLGELGLLARDGRRFRAEPDPDLWKTADRKTTESAKTAAAAAGEALPAAEGASSPPVAKTANTLERNVPNPDRSASRPVDNRAAEKLARVVASFAGPLADEGHAALSRLVAVHGIAWIWSRLAPSLGRGRETAAGALRELLRPQVPGEPGDGKGGG